MLKKLTLVIVALFTLVSCSKTSGLVQIAKEQGISQAAGAALTQITNFLNPSYLLALVESNRVHSVKHGKGLKLNIVNMNNNIKLYAEPRNIAGSKRQLFNNNYLLPGNYKLTTSIGTKSFVASFTKNVQIDYFDITQRTESKADRGLGRLKITLSPSDAKIVIYGTPHKYHEGLRLPEGKYKVKVEKKGFKTQFKTIAITENKLSTASFTLQTELKKANDVEIIVVTGAKKAPSEANKEQNNPDEKKVKVEQGSLLLNPAPPHITYFLENEDKKVVKYSPNMPLPIGEYKVIAMDVTKQQAIQIKTIEISALQTKKLTFAFEVAASKIEVQATFNITVQNARRERSVLLLTDEEGESYRFTKRVRKQNVTHEILLKEGKYNAVFSAKNIKYKLGQIELSSTNTNKFEFQLN